MNLVVVTFTEKHSNFHEFTLFCTLFLRSEMAKTRKSSVAFSDL